MFDAEQVNKGKVIAIVMYIIPILFFLPLVMDEFKNDYCKFHANQALLIFLMYIIASVLVFTIIVPIVFYIAAFIFFVMGIISAVNGTDKPLPIIGGIKLIK